MGPGLKKAPRTDTKPHEVKLSSDPGVNEMLHKAGREFSEGLKNEDDEHEHLHELDDSTPLEKRDDHLNDDDS